VTTKRQVMIPLHVAISTPELLSQGNLEQAWLEDQEEQSYLEAELGRLEQRKQKLRSEMPGYDARIRHDSRFPDSVVEDAGAGTHNDRLSLDGDEPPVY
jgi:hypothetical protein